MNAVAAPLCKTGEGSHREHWPLMMLSMLMFTAVALYFLIDSLSSVLLFIFSLPLTLSCAIFALMAFLEMQRLLGEVRITAEGLCISRPLSRDQHLRWADFQQVCLCLYVSGRGGIDRTHTQLCFVCKGEQRSMYDRWKTHSPFHHRRLIAIDYDEALFGTVRAICPLEIMDLRSTPPYQPFNKEASL